jgi:hypothetical protein
MDNLVNCVLEVDIDGQKHAAHWPPATLTIPKAKKALAATFGVKPEAVEV